MARTTSQYEWTASLVDKMSGPMQSMGKRMESAMERVSAGLDALQETFVRGINAMGAALGKKFVPLVHSQYAAFQRIAESHRIVAKSTQSFADLQNANARRILETIDPVEKHLSKVFGKMALDVRRTAESFGASSPEVARAMRMWIDQAGGLEKFSADLGKLAQGGHLDQFLVKMNLAKQAAGGILPEDMARAFYLAMDKIRPDQLAAMAEQAGHFTADVIQAVREGNAGAIDQVKRQLLDLKDAAPPLVGVAKAFFRAGQSIRQSAERFVAKVAGAVSPVAAKIAAPFHFIVDKLTAATKAVAAFGKGLGISGGSKAAASGSDGDGEETKKSSLALRGVAAAFGPMLKSIGPIKLLADAIQPVFDALSTQLMPLLTPLTELLLQGVSAMQPFIDALLPVIQDMFTQLTPIFLQFVNSLQPMLTQLMPVLSSVLGTLIQAIGPVLDALMPILKVFADILMAILPALEPVIRMIAGQLIIQLKMLTPVIEFVGKAISVVAQGIASVINWMIKVLQKIPVIGKYFKGADVSAPSMGGGAESSMPESSPSATGPTVTFAAAPTSTRPDGSSLPPLAGAPTTTGRQTGLAGLLGGGAVTNYLLRMIAGYIRDGARSPISAATVRDAADQICQYIEDSKLNPETLRRYDADVLAVARGA